MTNNNDFKVLIVAQYSILQEYSKTLDVIRRYFSGSFSGCFGGHFLNPNPPHTSSSPPRLPPSTRGDGR